MEDYKESFVFENPKGINVERFMKRSTLIIKSLSKNKRFQLIKSMHPLLVEKNTIIIELKTRKNNNIIISIILDKNNCISNVQMDVQMDKDIKLKRFFYFFIKEKIIKKILGKKRIKKLPKS